MTRPPPPQPDTGRDPLKTAREEIEDNHAPDDALHNPELCKACEGLRELDALAARLAETEAQRDAALAQVEVLRAFARGRW